MTARHAPNPSVARCPRRRGATLIEAVAVVLVLAIAVPPTVSWLLRAADRRADAILIARATTLASTVLDQVLSDASTADVASNAAYVSGSGGLRSRLASMTQSDESAGMTYAVAFGAASNQLLAVDSTSALNVFRTVTVTVSYTDSAGVSRAVPIASVIAKP